MDKMAMGDRFKEIRTRTGLSQKDFGKPVGMSISEVKNVEYHITAIREDKIPLICKEYGINEDWLRYGTGERDKPKSLGDALGEIAAEAAQNNVEAVRKFFRELGDEFTDAEILFLYQIYKSHFGKDDKK